MTGTYIGTILIFVVSWYQLHILCLASIHPLALTTFWHFGIIKHVLLLILNLQITESLEQHSVLSNFFCSQASFFNLPHAQRRSESHHFFLNLIWLWFSVWATLHGLCACWPFCKWATLCHYPKERKFQLWVVISFNSRFWGNMKSIITFSFIRNKRY